MNIEHLTSRELASKYKVSIRTAQRWKKQGYIANTRGRKKLFSESCEYTEATQSKAYNKGDILNSKNDTSKIVLKLLSFCVYILENGDIQGIKSDILDCFNLLKSDKCDIKATNKMRKRQKGGKGVKENDNHISINEKTNTDINKKEPSTLGYQCCYLEHAEDILKLYKDIPKKDYEAWYMNIGIWLDYLYKQHDITIKSEYTIRPLIQHIIKTSNKSLQKLEVCLNHSMVSLYKNIYSPSDNKFKKNNNDINKKWEEEQARLGIDLKADYRNLKIETTEEFLAALG